MIRVLKCGAGIATDNGFVWNFELACSSTDEKPTDGVMGGSVCIETDTGNIYVFDEESGTWTLGGSAA